MWRPCIVCALALAPCAGVLWLAMAAEACLRTNLLCADGDAEGVEVEELVVVEARDVLKGTST